MIWTKISARFIIKNFKKFIFDEDFRFMSLRGMGVLDDMADRVYLEKLFKAVMGQKLDLDNPVTYNEKIQWLKLYDRNPLYTILVDKVEVKNYVAKIIGEEYIIPTIGVWDSPDDIDFNLLPEQFVLKCNHNSGLGLCICHDKSSLNYEQVREELRASLKQNYYLFLREWPYKDVKRKILAEKYMVSDGEKELVDYKLLMFNGTLRCSLVCTRRYSQEGVHVTFYDDKWNIMPFEQGDPREEEPIPCPASYQLMIELAEKLSKNIPFVRVDFYEINEKPYFGEMTFYPTGGLKKFTPFDADVYLGNWIQLPEKLDK